MTVTHRHLANGPASHGCVETECGLHLTADDFGPPKPNEASIQEVIAAYQALPPCEGCLLIRAATAE